MESTDLCSAWCVPSLLFQSWERQKEEDDGKNKKMMREEKKNEKFLNLLLDWEV